MQLCGELPCTSWSAGGGWGGIIYTPKSHAHECDKLACIFSRLFYSFRVCVCACSAHCWMVGGRTTTSAHTITVHSRPLLACSTSHLSLKSCRKVVSFLVPIRVRVHRWNCTSSHAPCNLWTSPHMQQSLLSCVCT